MHKPVAIVAEKREFDFIHFYRSMKTSWEELEDFRSGQCRKEKIEIENTL